MAGPSYLENAVEGFATTADVLFDFKGCRLPAHSQFLAAHSKFFATMLKDLASVPSPSEPLVVPAVMLASFTRQHIEFFLSKVYKLSSKSHESSEQLYQLLRLADLFDAPEIMKTALEACSAQPRLLLHPDISETGVLKWAILSQQHGLHELHDRAVQVIAENIECLYEDPRLNQLSRSSALQLLSAVQSVKPAGGWRLDLSIVPSGVTRVLVGYIEFVPEESASLDASFRRMGLEA